MAYYEAQHGLLIERAKGIYSFSHLTFHEYFAARKLVASAKSDIFQQRLLPHLTEKRWREVFLLTVGMVESADELLQTMKVLIDSLVAEDAKIQQFIAWVFQKSSSIKSSCKPVAIRAYYLDLSLANTLDRDLSLYLDLSRALDLSRVLSFDLNLDLDLSLYLDLARARARAFDLSLFLSISRSRTLNSVLRKLLHDLRHELPDRKNQKQFKLWWKANGTAWTEQFRRAIIQHRNIGHDWQFDNKQKRLLSQYYDANKLLVDCLNSDCYVSREVRREIEESLLLPCSQQRVDA